MVLPTTKPKINQNTNFTVPSQPWASGRLLSETQRARKRELDRESQRRRRQKLQDRIEELELELPRVALKVERETVAHIERLTIENKMLRSTINRMQFPSYTQSNLPSWNPYPDFSINNPTRKTYLYQQTNRPVKNLMSMCCEDAIQPSQYGNRNFLCHTALTKIDTSPTDSTVLQAQEFYNTAEMQPVPSIDEIADLLDPPKINAIKEMANQLLFDTYCSNRSQICIDDTLNQDAVIRGIVEGWNVHDHRSPSCPIWRALRIADQTIAASYNIFIRLTMMRTAHLMIMSFIRAEVWTETTPQCRTKHGLGELPILDRHPPDQVASLLIDEILRSFRRSMSLRGSNDLFDFIQLDLKTGLYGFSKKSERHSKGVAYPIMYNRTSFACDSHVTDLIQAQT